MPQRTRYSDVAKVYALKNGTVIDHIRPGKALKVLEILGFDDDWVVAVGLNFDSGKLQRKDIIKFENRYLENREQVYKIALVAPEATVVRIENAKVAEKYQVAVPDTFEGLMSCANPKCITRNEEVTPRFRRVGDHGLKFRCHYCERTMYEADVKDHLA